MAGYLRSLNPQLPRSVQILQLGGLANAFGNGLVIPFLFIYLHNVRGFSLGLAGLDSRHERRGQPVAGPLSGPLIDRVGGRRMLAVALGFLAVGYGAIRVRRVEPWQASLASAIAGIGNGGFWPSQSSLIAGLTPPERRHAAFAMQRVMMNLGIGLGGLAGGLIASADPGTFTSLFLARRADVPRLSSASWSRSCPSPQSVARRAGERAGSYRDVLRNRVVRGLHRAELRLHHRRHGPARAVPRLREERGRRERARDRRSSSFVNTLVIVLAQLPIARLARGPPADAVLALLGVVWAAAWLLDRRRRASGSRGGAAFALLAVAVAVFGIGECLHGTVQAPLVADLADHRLLGRYMALSAFSWSVGFTLGPAVGGFVPRARAARVLARRRGGLPRRRRRRPRCSSARCRRTSAARRPARTGRWRVDGRRRRRAREGGSGAVMPT